VNAGDLEALVSLLHRDCIAEHAWTDAAAVATGREMARAAWARELADYEGARPGGRRVDVTRVAGMEAGWGWVRAEWESAVRHQAGGDVIAQTGYTDFWIEDGVIRRVRRIARPGTAASSQVGAAATASEAAAERRHEIGTRGDLRPTVGVGAVIVQDGRVVLVKRRHEPLRGQWSLPGGGLELGETLEAGVAREALEETGLVVDVGPVIEVFDRILLDPDGDVRFHFVIVDYLCAVREGRLRAGGDAEDVALVAPADLDAYGLTEKAREVIAQALGRHRSPSAKGVAGL
jgi:ADP-ribose pyrophosphatase YjhB (NUDIX family)